MALGTVKWYNLNKGYGFIKPDERGPDVFVHANSLNTSGIHTLNEGDKVSYETEAHKDKTSAIHLKVL